MVMKPAGATQNLVAVAVRRILLSGSVGMLASAGAGSAAELPVPCVAGSCGATVSSWLGSGAAQATQSGNTLTINQSTDRVTLNWSSFNVSADGRVIFNQPSRTSIALNRIFQDSPSRIFGQVQANGEIYLVNPNGMIFGRTSKVDAAGLMASTLQLSDANFAAGIASPSLIQNLQPALQGDGRVNVVDASGNPILGRLDADGRIIADPAGQPIAVQLSLQQGAKIATTGAGGRVLLAGQKIDNAGSITAADGQVILAAGDKVYLQASSDPALRGLLVEVGAAGVVTNAATGDISTARGNTTLIGLAVNQLGRISATTTVSANGSVRLLARGAAEVATVDGVLTPQARTTGALTFGTQSLTSVTSETSSTETAVDDQAQLASTIEGVGRQVLLKGGSRIIANGGTLKLSATADPTSTIEGGAPTLPPGFHDAQSQLRIENGAHIDLSGTDATVAMSRNMVRVELRANELKDSPNQRDSAIRGQPLVVDARVGTPLGDVSGAIAATPRTVAERTSKGGTAMFSSDGDVVVAKGATVDVSGGKISYEGGYLQTSKLIGADGKLYDVGTADPSRTYVGVVNPTYRVIDDRWGRITEVPYANIGQYQQGYVEGRGAGTVQFAAPSMLLNGTFRANTVVGPYQRSAALAPVGGTFIVGLQKGVGFAPSIDYRAPDVSFTDSPTDVTVEPGSALPAWLPLSLSTDYLRNGFTRTLVNSNGRISLALDHALQLAPGSTFSLAGQNIAINSGITSAGGAIALNTRDTIGLPGQFAPAERIAIGHGVTLDVSGGWYNDSLLAGGPGNTPLFYNGGSISMKTSGTVGDAALELGDAVSLLANGGAWYRNAVTGGRGGSISLAGTRSGAVEDAAWHIGKDIRLEGFGVANATGGSFALDAPAIQVTQDSTWSRGQQLAAGSDAYLRLGTSLFSDHGFAKFQLVATRPATGSADTRPVFEVLPGTVLQARVLTRALAGSAAQRASGGTVADFSSVYLPLAEDLQAATLTFRAGLARGPSSAAGSLSIGTGAVLEGTPGSAFHFSSQGNLLMAGTVRSHGGSITASLLQPDGSGVEDSGYIAGRRIQLAGTGVLDVSGALVPTSTDTSLLLGKVLAGGAVTLAAERGMVAVESGSTIDVSGASATLDLATRNESQPYQRQQVGSAGGSLSVKTREGAYLLGNVHAAAGADDSGTLAAGALRLEVSRTTPGIAPGTYPAGEAQINVTARDLPVVGAVPAGYVGISQEFIQRAGFDSLSLRAFDDSTPGGGHIVLNAGLDLSLARRISLEAPVIALNGVGAVTLRAPLVSLGDVLGSAPPAQASTGSASLRVDAGHIDLLGATVVNGADRLRLDSSGDIRLRGANRSDGTSVGSFTLAGDLTLAASRVYASSASQFTLTAAGGATDRIRFEQRGTSPVAPLSAASRITVVADQIDQGGTLLAPFGAIKLQAQTINLLAGSLTSVSGAGLRIPYGRTLNGVWFYDNGNTAVAPEVGTLPERDIALQGDAVSIAASATVDLSGGGDLYAYEWVPGTGGSTDALAAGARAGLYAVLPSLAGQVAPYDPQEYAGSDLVPGDSIYLSGYGDLPAGFYPLLPARYALLPGAYLVSVVPGSTEYVPGYPAALRDGTTVIAGYRSFGTTGFGNAQMSAIAIRPGSYGRRLAEYTDYLASNYFPSRARLLEQNRPTVPLDAGSFSIFAGNSLDLAGMVRTAPATGGQGASISVSANNLAITGAGGDGDANTVDIAAATLNAWTPAHLTLGGVRAGSGDGALGVTAGNVTLRSGVTLAVRDVVLAARDGIVVENGATIRTPSAQGGASPPQLTADAKLGFSDAGSAGAAVLAVSDDRQLDIDRAGSTGTGSITLAQGSLIATRGALNMDAPGGMTAEGSLQVADADVALGAARVVFADAPQAGALVIDASLQDSLDEVRALALTASESLEFRRSTTLDLGNASGTRLELRAPVLLGSGNAVVSLVADSVAFGGAAAAGTTAPQAGTAQLTTHSRSLELQGGNLDLAGFARSTLTADQQVVASGTSHYRASGDLEINSPRILVASNADTSLDVATGAVRLASSATPLAPGDASLQLGGALAIHAQQITDATTIQAASGLVSLDATNSLSLEANAVIDVAGRMVTAGGRQLGSQGGAISLASGGTVATAAASRMDLSGAGDSAAGTLAVAGASTVSLQGTLQAQAAGGAQGGEFQLAAGTLADFTTLNTALEAGGFNRRRSLRVDNGDLALAAGQRITARTVDLLSNNGQVRIDGTINAASVDYKGAIRIEGGAGVTIGATANLVTDSTGTANSGGDISIGSERGALSLATGSRFSAMGNSAKGNLTLRATSTGTDVAIDALPADLSRLGNVAIAPVFATNVSAAPTATELNNARAPATSFANLYGSAVLARLNAANAANVSLRPEVQLRRAGDITLGALDLSTWRYNGPAGTLSVVATGDIRTSGTISDGFTGTGTTLALASGDSTSINLRAGRDLLLGTNSVLRTGTGSITLDATRDLVFNTGATVYTAGVAGTATRTLSAQTGTVSVVFPDQGGEVRLLAGRDITGSPVTQSATNWQFRGTRTGAAQEMPRLWGALLTGFGWNAGTLGGGDMEVRAGRNVTNLSAATADSEVVAADNTISHFGGGSLRVSAGADINSGEFFTSYGRMDLTAGGKLGSSRASPLGDALGSLLWMADTNATVTARNGALLESVLNSTALLAPRAPNQGSRPSSFFTVSDDASLRVQSAVGDVVFHNNAERLSPFIETNVRQQSGDFAHFAVYPPRLDARAYTDDLYFEQTAYLFPARQGQLNLFAGRDLSSNGTGGVLMSDGAANGISSILAPAVGSAPMTELLKGASATRHLLDDQQALVTAGRDVRDIALSLPVATQVVADRDIADISLLNQNVHADDVTLVQAGRDVVFGLDGIGSQILTGGAGRLDILAGRNIDLGFSQGVVTTGNLRNTTLPGTAGADISMFAGLGQEADFASFIDKVIAPSDAYRTAVVDFMRQRDGLARSPTDALAAFTALDDTAQRPLVTRLFFAELVQSGRDANLPKGSFARGYAAIDALFPGSRSTTTPSPFDGDINMSFSRIYTLAGGDISLLAPGGMLNVGLANPPPAFGTRDPSQLGIVAQRSGSARIFTRDDVLVNQSRVFTLLGGDIAIWSTLGNIDAGRGAKSSLSAPPPTVLIDDTGKVTIDFSAAVAGSGIRTVVTGEGVQAGDVDLIAPAGFVNAGDAGIGSAGNLNIAAQTVIGLDNIQVGGASTGVPAEAGGLGAALAGVSSVGSSASAADQTDVASGATTTEATSIAQTALTWLDVFLEGFGTESCSPNDRACLERQQ